MSLSAHVRQQVLSLLKNKRVLVWFDGERAFEGFVKNFSAQDVRVVRMTGSRLQARQEAEIWYRQINQPDAPFEIKNGQLLVYLPYPRVRGDAQLHDPFEVFAAAGDSFGDDEAEQLRSLALQALPEYRDQIERLFREGKPTLEVIDHLEQAPTYPLVDQALGTHAVIDVTSRFLGDPKPLDIVLAIKGCFLELVRLLVEEFGFSPQRGESDPAQTRKQLARYVLYSEFALGISGDLPAALAGLSPSSNAPRERIRAVADRLRQTDSYREVYLALADQVEQELKLEDLFKSRSATGQTLTFPFQERQLLTEFISLLQDGNLIAARKAVSDFRQSVWRYVPEREQVWRVAERCMDLLEIADRVEKIWKQQASSLREMISAYIAEDGWSDLDRAQRLMEHGLARFSGYDELEELVALCRSRYRQVINAIQQQFLKHIEKEGWPPEGYLRQTQVYDRFIAPPLANREKVVYVLSDSLRFEMGRDLLQAIDDLGQAELHSVTATLPTITEVGMAALLPGADGALVLREQNEDLIPHIGERPLKDLTARLAYFRERLGDRMSEVEISKFLSSPSKKSQQAAVGNADLVILRDTRIDALGENVSLHDARRYMSEMLPDLKTAITQLLKLGYSRFVIAADHGHILLPEILPGEVVTQPSGEWGLSKRRVRLGRQARESTGTVSFPADKLGIHGDPEELIVPSGFGVYSAGSGYLHGGISLQEAVLPLITLRATVQPATQSAEQIQIIYNKKVFTSSVIGIKLFYTSLFSSQLRVRVEAFDGPGVRAKRVGEAAESEARDEITYEVILSAGVETPVPVLLDHDFSGDSIEIRVTDPDTQRIWERLTLKNGMLD